ncbi:hypothetical protein D9M71_749580 [compost metagenome]
MDAQPGQRPIGESAPHGPYDQRQQEQAGRDQALAGLPGRLVRGLELVNEGDEPLAVVLRQIKQG